MNRNSSLNLDLSDILKNRKGKTHTSKSSLEMAVTALNHQSNLEGVSFYRYLTFESVIRVHVMTAIAQFMDNALHKDLYLQKSRIINAREFAEIVRYYEGRTDVVYAIALTPYESKLLTPDEVKIYASGMDNTPFSDKSGIKVLMKIFDYDLNKYKEKRNTKEISKFMDSITTEKTFQFISEKPSDAEDSLELINTVQLNREELLAQLNWLVPSQEFHETLHLIPFNRIISQEITELQYLLEMESILHPHVIFVRFTKEVYNTVQANGDIYGDYYYVMEQLMNNKTECACGKCNKIKIFDAFIVDDSIQKVSVDVNELTKVVKQLTAIKETFVEDLKEIIQFRM